MSTNRMQQAVHSVSNAASGAVRYLWEAAGRIFSPTDDHYPKTGVQPFEGETPNDRS